MRKRTFIIFVTYIWLKTLIGLIARPYKSVRDVSRHNVLFPVVLSPLYGLIALFVFGRIGAYLIDIYGLKRELMAFLLSCGLISIVLWQVLLIYLLLNFLKIFKNN